MMQFIRTESRPRNQALLETAQNFNKKQGLEQDKERQLTEIELASVHLQCKLDPDLQ